MVFQPRVSIIDRGVKAVVSDVLSNLTYTDYEGLLPVLNINGSAEHHLRAFYSNREKKLNWPLQNVKLGGILWES